MVGGTAGLAWCSVTVKTACDRLDTTFISVAAVVLQSQRARVD